MIFANMFFHALKLAGSPKEMLKNEEKFDSVTPPEGPGRSTWGYSLSPFHF